MEYWVLAILALLMAALAALIVGGKAAHRGRIPASGARARAREPCTICGAPLGPGERMRSEVFPGRNERMVHLFGCPHCYPANSRWPRICPVCRAPLAADGHVVGRMWEKRAAAGRPEAGSPPRRHLHVLGCTSCRKPSRGAASS